MTDSTFSLPKLPWRLIGWGAAGSLLLLPAIAMQFTSEVRWGPFDFLAMAFMLGILGLGIELAVRVSRNSAYRGGAALALLTGFLVTWSNLAVGIIGSEDHPANGMFFAVLAIAVIASFVAQFRPKGLALATGLAAAGQFAVPFVAIAIWRPELTFDLVKTVAFNSVFAAMWAFASAMFRRVGQA